MAKRVTRAQMRRRDRSPSRLPLAELQADPMKRLRVELLDRPSRHAAHGRPPDGLGKGFGIAEVIFMAFAEGPHEPGRDQILVLGTPS